MSNIKIYLIKNNLFLIIITIILKNQNHYQINTNKKTFQNGRFKVFKF